MLLSVEGATVALIVVVSAIVLVRLLAGTAPGGQTFTWSVFSVPPGTDTSALFLGVVFGFLNAIAPDRLAPEIVQARDLLLTSTNLPLLSQLTAARSTATMLDRLRMPVFWLQGRRDFVFDLAIVKEAERTTREELAMLASRAHRCVLVGVPEAPGALDCSLAWALGAATDISAELDH